MSEQVIDSIIFSCSSAHRARSAPILAACNLAAAAAAVSGSSGKWSCCLSQPLVVHGSSLSGAAVGCARLTLGDLRPTVLHFVLAWFVQLGVVVSHFIRTFALQHRQYVCCFQCGPGAFTADSSIGLGRMRAQQQTSCVLAVAYKYIECTRVMSVHTL